MKEFISKKALSGLVILCGDFNVNSAQKKPSKFECNLSKIKGQPEFAKIIPLLNNEYFYMIKALTSDKWELIDLIRESSRGG